MVKNRVCLPTIRVLTQILSCGTGKGGSHRSKGPVGPTLPNQAVPEDECEAARGAGRFLLPSPPEWEQTVDWRGAKKLEEEHEQTPLLADVCQVLR